MYLQTQKNYMNSDPVLLNEWPDFFPLNKVEELEKLAAVGYTPEKVAMYFGINEEEFMMEFIRQGSRVRYHYDRGILVNEAKEAIEMQTGANEGNVTQSQRLDKRRYQLRFEQLKERICYGKE